MTEEQVKVKEDCFNNLFMGTIKDKFPFASGWGYALKHDPEVKAKDEKYDKLVQASITATLGLTNACKEKDAMLEQMAITLSYVKTYYVNKKELGHEVLDMAQIICLCGKSLAKYHEMKEKK